ncbi:MAG: phosphodiester glycosidase family protein [Fimbriimonadaceae bacterium]
MRWPLSSVSPEPVGAGVTRWIRADTGDGTSLELYRYDFKTNSKLKLEMYDQDEDDAAPFDNKTDFFDRNAAWVALHLRERGRIVAVWNGLFHGYDRSRGGPPEGLATHIGPNVIRGKARYNYGSVRWAFGVKNGEFILLKRPKIAEMEANMTFGAVGAQCLVHDGKRLDLADQAIKGVDDLRTSRTSMAWSRDNRYFYLLFVNEPDSEGASKRALRFNLSEGDGGWTLKQVQDFWVSFGADYAINSDGGSVAQLVHLQADSNYRFVPPKWASDKPVMLGPGLKGAVSGGGTLMSWAIIEKE